MKHLIELIKQHKSGQLTGIYSVCSAHPLVLEAAIRQAKRDNKPVLIEATSNQVNQDGGYTGMTPSDFVGFVGSIADSVGFDKQNILLGGDHLGPNCWQKLDAEQAMVKSEALIASYVEAGFRKIHLDCSMSCAGDSQPLSDEVVAQRAARLCKVAEQSWKKAGGEAPVYIIGTEVPVPGGAKESLSAGVEVTKPEAAEKTISVHQKAFEQSELQLAWQRVIGLVVQPGVEFDHHTVIHYQREKARQLSELINKYPSMVFEAHSTDYQPDASYRELVEDHFAVLKVGPALTFAMREALFALDRVEQEWIAEGKRANLRKTLEMVMTEQPGYWRDYYQSSGNQQYLDCAYSLSDRIRYYWPDQQVENACARLIDNLNQNQAPLTLLSQYMAEQAKAISAGEIENTPKELIIHKVMEVTKVYACACSHEHSGHQE